MSASSAHHVLRLLQELIAAVVHQLLATYAQDPSSIHNHSFHKWPHLGSRTIPTALRAVYLASLSHAHIQQESLLTKRDIYYLCRPLFPTPSVVDRIVRALSHALCVPSNDLNIVAAPKGIVTGSVRYVDEDGYRVDVRLFSEEGCLIPPRPERMREVCTDACAVVVYVAVPELRLPRSRRRSRWSADDVPPNSRVAIGLVLSNRRIEKEAAFHSLLGDPAATQLLDTCIFVTGKGYPDFATRLFLNRVSSAQKEEGKNIPIYVLTDADPHGIAIAYCYIRELPAAHVQWIGVQPSDNGRLFNLSPTCLLDVTPREGALLDNMLARMTSSSRAQDLIVISLVRELTVLRTTRVKFEMEALASIEFSSGVSGLLGYLLQRTDHEPEA